MYDNEIYEYFVRPALQFDSNSRTFRKVGHQESYAWDLVSPNNLGFLAEENITYVKIVTSYALLMYINEVLGYSDDPKIGHDKEVRRIKQYIDHLHDAQSIKDVCSIISSFNDTVLQVYFDVSDDGVYLPIWDGLI